MALDNVGEIINLENELEDDVQAETHGGVDSNETLHINEVIEESGSLVGVVAEKWEELYEIYKRHSQEIGFSIRKSGVRRADAPGAPEFEGYFVCSCEGQHGNGKKAKPSLATNGQGKKNVMTRCFCKANVRIQVNTKGVWKVLSHTLEHNHPLTPPPMATSPSFREENYGCRRLKMKSIEGGDASTLINLLTSRQAEDPGFFFRVQFGEDGRLCNVFWRDSMMKEDYLLYHDVVIFDTTYRTNRYNLICGAFVGINNHWSNVMFGFAFLANERQESFEWLFNAFNESMGLDTVPVSIFTDQDLAMNNAIEKIYPTTRHRLCQWHIQQNAISHFGLLKHDRTFQNAFNKCLNGCYNENEFEETWSKMISDYGLQKNEWFQRLYGLKHKWSTALNKYYFSAGILSSQRSESTNHAIGFQATKTTSLTEFYHIYEGTVKRWRGEEERKEFNCIRSTPTSAYPLVDLLQHASQVYTLELYSLFEKEFVVAMGTRAVILPTEDPILVYGVDPPGVSGSTHHVTFDCANMMVDCSCRKIQEMGIPCFHIIRVFHMHSVFEIPTRYILRRWTKFAKREVWSRLLPNDMCRAVANGSLNWRRSLMTKLYNLITKCQNEPEARTIVDKLYTTANDEVQKLFKAKLIIEEPSSDLAPNSTTVLDPLRSVTKGRRKRKESSIGKKKSAKKSQQNAATHPQLYTPIPRLL
ncbi:hypothetical protein KSS87_011392 [Heliosperma pusillum]|nr:hypothetical protein KSS87_011392 [Heliosperma pusillum]